MRFLDSLLGRTKPKAPDLDAMFALPSAAVTLESSTGLRPSGQGAVAYKPASGAAFATTGEDLHRLLQLSGEQSATTIGSHDDRYGYRWIVVEDPDVEDIVTSIHLVNRALEARWLRLTAALLGVRFLRLGHRRGTLPPRLPVQARHVLPLCSQS